MMSIENLREPLGRVAMRRAVPPASLLTRPGTPPHWTSGLTALLPGLFLTSSIATLAFLVRSISGAGAASPLMIAIVIGMLTRNLLGVRAEDQPGIVFSMRRVLRFGIMLLGLQLSLAQMIAVGAGGLIIIAATLAATFAVTIWLAPRFGVDRKLAELIAAGTSICGASAVIATNSVTRAPEEDVAYAVACVTVFGSASMLIYPWLSAFLHMPAHAYGLWAGASIHEIAQVVAATFQAGQQAGEFGTIAKLTRVMLLAPMVLAFGYAAARRTRAAETGGDRPLRQATPVPWFVLGFVAMMLVSSLDLIPGAAKAELSQGTTFLLTIGLAAMGLETNLRKLAAKGWRPLLLAAASWLFISSVSFVLVELAAV
jgi:uncharacterized integral membrane protein (TIGR00698 family)